MILVTGATGFLGAELIHQLTGKGNRVRALKRSGSAVPAQIHNNDLIEWVVGDINDIVSLEDVIEGVSKVYHCAALVSFDPKDKANLLRTNIEGTSNVVNLCAEHRLRLLHVSSVAALGTPKKGELITENNFWEYHTEAHDYSISKYEGEMEVWRGIAEGLDAVVVNPSIIIGPKAGYQGSGAIFKTVRKGLRFFTKGSTGLVDVEDVAKCMIALMESQERAERFIISAENRHYKELFGEIAAGFGLEPPSREARPWMMNLAWRAAWLGALFSRSTPALNKATARSALHESLYNNQKIIDTIGIQFKPLSQSIAEVCNGLKTHTP